MSTSRRLAKFTPALALLALAIPTAAFGQATRTWVSGVGDDVNPCSRTAPCKTFPGAISKTAAGGEINCLDPGGFGGVTITKSLTIKCHYTEGGVLVANTNAIVINAAATDKVTLRGLDVNGVGTGAPTSLVGIKVLGAKSVHVIDTEVYRFQVGISLQPSTASSRLVVKGSHIHNNGVGVFDGPGAAGGTVPLTTLRDNLIADNTCGATVSAFGPNASTAIASLDCGAAGSGSGLNTISNIIAFNNQFHDNGTAIKARGNNSQFIIGGNDISTNDTGLAQQDGGIIKSFGDNHLIDNLVSNGAPNAPNAAPSKRFGKRH